MAIFLERSECVAVRRAVWCKLPHRRKAAARGCGESAQHDSHKDDRGGLRMNDFVEALESDGRNPELPEEYDFFGRLVGS